MKKIILFIAASFIICTAFMSSAFRVLVTDYRDAYIGNYFCNRSCQRIRTEPATISDTITISVAKDPLDSILKITAGQNIFRAKLKNNSLLPYPASAPLGGKFFATDSLTFHSSAGLGHVCIFIGKKK